MVEKINTKKFNSRIKIDSNLYALYFWQVYYRQKGLSKEDACIDAIDKHPKLMPAAWGDFPYDLFQKKVTAIEKLKSISQKSVSKPLL